MNARAVKSALALWLLGSLVTSCRHTPPEQEKRSTEAEIRQHIVGEWVVAANSDGCWYPKLIIAGDGTLSGAFTNGTRMLSEDGKLVRVLTNEVSWLVGTWEMCRHLLNVTPVPATFKAHESGILLNEKYNYFPVIYADDHELVMTPGISMAGRWRYMR